MQYNNDETIEDGNHIEKNSENKPVENRSIENKDNAEEAICLKVKADPPDVSPEDRKRNVKRLAGAISHSLRGKGRMQERLAITQLARLIGE
jgi:hypothetical protein